MHCINISIFDQKNFDLLKEKIEKFVSVCLNEKQGFYGVPTGELPEDLEGLKYVIVNTDYFGGAGDQSAILINEDSTEEEFSDFTSSQPINEALEKYGAVEEKDMDIFDTLNLCMYRTDQDFYPSTEIESKKVLRKSLMEDNDNLESLIKQRDVIQFKIDKLTGK